jgi:hypothetical protein
MNKVTGAVVASLVAGLFAANAVAADKAAPAKETSTKVKCTGVNECKGKGECGSADGKHACAGHNDCKGKGWISMDSAKACTDKGGSVVAEAPKK